MKNQGGLSTAYAEPIKRHRNPIGQAFDLYISREATLTPDLSALSSRYLRGVVLVIREGFGDELQLTLDRRDVAALRDALDEALKQIEHDKTMREASA